MLGPVTSLLLLGTAMAITPAAAQQSMPPKSSNPLAVGAPSQATSTKSSMDKAQTRSGNQSVHYITRNTPDVWRTTKLDGVNIYNDQNEKIGSVDEVLINRDGQVDAVVIGVGGFLGIGERDVAVPFDAIQWQMTSPATTGASSSTASSSSHSGNADAPKRGVLPGASKDQLKNAPEFKYAS